MRCVYLDPLTVFRLSHFLPMAVDCRDHVHDRVQLEPGPVAELAPVEIVVAAGSAAAVGLAAVVGLVAVDIAYLGHLVDIVRLAVDIEVGPVLVGIDLVEFLAVDIARCLVVDTAGFQHDRIVSTNIV